MVCLLCLVFSSSSLLTSAKVLSVSRWSLSFSWLIYFNFKKMFYLSFIFIIHNSKNFTLINYYKFIQVIIIYHTHNYSRYFLQGPWGGYIKQGFRAIFNGKFSLITI